MFPVVMLVANVASVGVLWFGGHRVDAGEMQVGALTAYLAYLMQIVMAVMMGTFMMMMLPRATVCADRVMEVLDTETSVPRPTEPVTDLPLRGTLELDGRRAHLPRRGRAGAARHHVPRGARSDRGGDRLDRCRQEHPGQPGAADCSTSPPESCGSTASTYDASLPSGSGR
jgi:ABC-type multidrug transport system fused ATPase/permease subunit